MAPLTRGQSAAVDIDRLMSSTEANIVTELRAHVERAGILATSLDAKILHLPVLAASAIVRAYADAPLKTLMKASNISLAPNSQTDALDRLSQTELGALLQSGRVSSVARGRAPSAGSASAFIKLAQIASRNDVALNRTLAAALMEANLVASAATEQEFGAAFKVRSDILAHSGAGSLRLELMWRKSTSRGDIARYVLNKISNYGKAMGFFP